MYRKTGTSRNITASNPVLMVSDQAQRRLRRDLVWSGPAVSKTGVVMDVVEIGVGVAEFLADTLDEGTDIGAVPLCPMTGDEVLAVHEIIDLAIADVLPCLLGEKRQNLELGQGQFDRVPGPQRAIDVKAQLEPAERQHVGPRRLRIGSRALGNQLQASDENRQTSRLVDEIDRAAGERRLFVDVVGKRRQKDHRERDPSPSQVSQHLDAGELRHAPVKQHYVGAAALLEISERVAAVVEAGDFVPFIDQVEVE